jgi:hypothetical protein
MNFALLQPRDEQWDSVRGHKDRAFEGRKRTGKDRASLVLFNGMVLFNEELEIDRYIDLPEGWIEWEIRDG